jgi:hypothetical protein
MFCKIRPLHVSANDGDDVKAINTHKQILSHGHTHESQQTGHNVTHVIFETGVAKDLFLDISSTNIDTLVPALYQCVETHSIDVY